MGKKVYKERLSKGKTCDHCGKKINQGYMEKGLLVVWPKYFCGTACAKKAGYEISNTLWDHLLGS